MIDYGWTGYDSINALIVALNPNESRDARIEGLQTAVIAVGLEIIEPDGDLLPIDDLIRHGDDIVRLTDNVEEQIHHFMTNKNSKYTPKFEKIAQDFKLELDEAWNKGLLPHKGRHPNDYHDWVFTQVREITSELSSCKTNCSEKFVNLFYEKVVQPVINNPDMLRRKFWKEIE